MIEIRTLGPAAITIDGGAAPPELLWRKHLALLIYLARSPRGTRTRDHLLGLLWQDKPGSAARHSLNEALRIIRRVVGDDDLTTTVDQVTLRPGAVDLDVDRFENGADLVEGEFLEGLTIPGESTFEDWLAAERRLWRTRSVSALTGRAAELVAAGDHAAAISAAERAARLDPESEPATRALMEALARSGDAGAAGTAFRRFAERLMTAIGTAPSPALAGLADRLARGANRSRPAPSVTEAPTRRRGPLAGRTEAMKQLAEVWATVRASRAAAGLLLGDSGLGKTRLLEEIRAMATIDGGSVIMARMVEADRTKPFAALMAVARGGLAEAPGVAGARQSAIAALAAVLPDWADRFPAAAKDAGDPLADALVEVFDAVTREGPLVVVIDDAQWIDPESCAVLTLMERNLAARPFGVLMAAAGYPAREELDRFRARIGRDLPGAVISLAALDRNAIRALAAWAFPAYDAEALDRLTRRLLLETGGYPLFVIDLLDAIAAGIDLGDTRPWLKAEATLSQTLPGELPDTVIAAIRVGFRRLSADAQLVAGAAAVGPPRIDPDRLARVAGLPEERLGPALDQLEWTRWFTADPVGYTFVARIVREVVARDFVTGRQRRQWTDQWEGPA